MLNNQLSRFKSFYFVGIGGVSMSALAKLIKKMDLEVAGCDRVDGEYVEELKALGIAVEISAGGDVSDYDCVVYTDAVAENNTSVVQAKLLNIPLYSRGEFLNEFSKSFKRTIAVSGCHGKTTCVAMITHIFARTGRNFCSHIGGTDVVYSNAYLTGYDYFITEACEYKKNFLKLKPDFAVVLNADADHLDCYASNKELIEAYVKFGKSATNAVKLYGDVDGLNAETFGFDDRAQYYAKKIKAENGKYSFTAYEGDVVLGKITLDVYGKHNVLNALAAIAVARNYGIEFENIVAGIGGFCGVKRRFETIGYCNGATCIADYAHHPNEIKATLKAAVKITGGELYVVFQPHTYSRTKMLFKQFVSVLSTIKKLLIYKTYAAREYYDDAGSALTLSQNVKRATYGSNYEDIKAFIYKAGAGDTILFLGAGDIYDTAKYVVKTR